jgi:hypothetical protein
LDRWRVGGSISSGVTGVLPVANGGTGSATQNFVDLTTAQSSIGGAKTFTSGISATTDNRGLIIRGYTGAIGYNYPHPHQSHTRTTSPYQST